LEYRLEDEAVTVGTLVLAAGFLGRGALAVAVVTEGFVGLLEAVAVACNDAVGRDVEEVVVARVVAATTGVFALPLAKGVVDWTVAC
jgi:hypothetical protein